MTSTGRPSRQQARERLRAGPGVWPTLCGAAASFALASHESLIWPQILGCVLLALVVTSLASVVSPAGFAVEVEAPARVTVGEPFELVLRVAGRARLGRRGVVVRYRLRSARPLLPELAAFVDVVPAGGVALVRWTPTPLARGGADAADIEVEIAGPFGFFSRHAFRRVSQSLLCMPALAEPLEVSTGPGYQAGTASGVLPDADLRGVRDWRPGDQVSQVHWRSVVRTGRMTVVERDTRSAGSLVVIVLAPGKPAKQGKPARPATDAEFEARLSVAAATAVSQLRRGVPTCFVARAKGSGYRHPRDEDELLDCFARVTTTRPPDDALLEHALSHAAYGGAIMLVAATAPPSAAATIAASRRKIVAAAGIVGATVIEVGVSPMRESA